MITGSGITDIFIFQEMLIIVLTPVQRLQLPASQAIVDQDFFSPKQELISKTEKVSSFLMSMMWQLSKMGKLSQP